ncbi:hypothetical protein R9C00_26085 [Flammeovirgaceae bacterium SG7u.111]|nr:hypothetical protein [Flammeovirgaceae bacterium SG7u.132]WPO35168.1 hypothetical protein R9C00_26085 [Flammeovirgaceae bacterium SG7u.111]
MSELVEYLKKKKIDPELFKKAEPVQWNKFEEVFSQVHPDSFTAQKLFLINKIRRAYPLQAEEETEVKVPMKKKPRPVMRARPKPKTDE